MVNERKANAVAIVVVLICAAVAATLLVTMGYRAPLVGGLCSYLRTDACERTHEWHQQCPKPDDADFYDCDWWPRKQ